MIGQSLEPTVAAWFALAESRGMTSHASTFAASIVLAKRRDVDGSEIWIACSPNGYHESRVGLLDAVTMLLRSHIE